MSSLRGRRFAEQYRALVAAPQDTVVHGLAVPYGVPTGDGRVVEGNLRWNLSEESVPLIWDRHDGDHTGEIVGIVDELRADADGLHVVSARILGSDDPQARESAARVLELIEANAIGWSISMDDIVSETVHKDAEVVEADDGSLRITETSGDTMTRVLSARLRHIALVDTPAFPGARPILGPAPVNAAAVKIATYPAAHFEQWTSAEPVPLTVDKDGRVYGHAAGDGCYRGNNKTCQKYEVDADRGMRNFHTGTVTLDNGDSIRVGSLTAASLHAAPYGPVEAQRQHHENTSTIWAKVIAWDDAYGRLCVSGSVVPGVDERTVNQCAGQPVSVEKWPVPGVPGLTLVGVHTVNLPAWPVI